MISYTKRDYQGIKKELIEYAKTLTPDWTDFSEGDLGMVNLEMLAGVSAMLNFYIDKQASECYIDSCIEPRNIKSLLELIGYKNPLRAHAVATQVVELPSNHIDSVYPNEIRIPAYTTFKNPSNIFCTLEDAVIPVGSRSVEIPIAEGKRVVLEYEGRDILKDYKFNLPSYGVCESGFKLYIDNELWTKVDNAFLKTEGGKFYSVHRDAYDNHYILFTFNYATLVHDLMDVRIEFFTSTGEFNLEPRKVIDFNESIYDSTGKTVNSILSTYNKDFFTGGFTNNDILLEKALHLKEAPTRNNPLVALSDYNNFFKVFPGVQDANIIDSSIRGYEHIRPYELEAYILPNTLNPMSEPFKKSLLDKMYEKSVSVTRVNLRDAVIKTASILTDITLVNPALDKTVVEKEVYNVLHEEYSRCAFNKSILLDDIRSLILKNVPQVKTVKVLEPIQDLVPEKHEVYKIDVIRVGGTSGNN